MRKLTIDPNAEVLGMTVLAFSQNLNEDEIRPFLVKHGLDQVGGDQWIPAQMWLDVLNDLAEHSNLMSNLVAIGMALADVIPLPSELMEGGLPAVLHAWNDIYHMQHRNGDIGQVTTTNVSDTHIRVDLQDAYPADMSYGIAYGWARKLLPKQTHFTVKYDEDIPHQDNGGDVTVIHVNW